MDTDTQTYISSDVMLTAFCIVNGVKLLNISEEYPNHFLFKLEDLERCVKLKQEYLNNAPAPARELFSVREMLISEMKNRNRNGENYGNTK